MFFKNVSLIFKSVNILNQVAKKDYEYVQLKRSIKLRRVTVRIEGTPFLSNCVRNPFYNVYTEISHFIVCYNKFEL